MVLVINAGSDLAGDITITGTSVNRETGTETGSDTSVITIDAVTTDNSSTDGNSVTIAEFAGAYISDKWFRGAIVISTTDVNLSDVDVYQIAFEQANDQTEFSLDTLDVSAYATNSSAWVSGYLYSVEVTGDKVDIVNEAGGAFAAATIDANKWYRMRRGNIAKTLDGSTDGFYFDLVLGPGASNYWENINAKVWTLSPLSGVVAVGGAGSFDPGTSYTWTADQTVNDNVDWKFGTGGDARIYYDGGDLVLKPDQVGTGRVEIQGGGLRYVGTTSTWQMDASGYSQLWSRTGAHYNYANAAGGYFIWRTNASTTAKMTLDTAGNLSLPQDNVSLLLGAAGDASIYFDGSDLIITPENVATTNYTRMGNSATHRTYWGAGAQSGYLRHNGSSFIFANTAGSTLFADNTGGGFYFQPNNVTKMTVLGSSVTVATEFRVDDQLIRFKELAVPSTGASTYGKLFLSSVTGNLSIVKDTGTVVDLEAGGGASSPLTTKGDLWGYDSADARVPVGTDGQVLVADSAQTLGIKWAAAGSGDVANDAIWDAKGDLAVATGANAASKLTVGTNDYVLTADSAEATGMKWAAAAGGGSDPLTPTASKTSAYTAAAGDYVLCDTNTTGAFTVTLPAAATAGTGAQIGCKKTTSDFNVLTIDGATTETIDGALTKTLLAQYESLVLLCDGSNWHIIG